MTVITLSREFDFLSACCKAAYAGSGRKFSSMGLDWERLVRLARFHRVQGLVWKGLSEYGQEAPEKAAKSLASEARSIAGKNLRMAHECRALIDAFEAAGICPLFVKGLTLAALAYGDCSAKSGIDIDMVVESAELVDSAGVLSSLGYRVAEPPPATSAAMLAKWHRARKESLWINPETALKVDLHTRLADNPRLIPRVGSNSPRQSVVVPGNLELPTLNDEDLFAYLAVHGASSAWFRLKWITDFAAFAQRLGLDRIESFYRSSQRLGAGRAADQALLLAHRIYGLLSEAPALEAELKRNRVSVWLEKVALRQLAGRAEPVEPTAGWFGTASIHYTQLAMMPGLAYPLSELSRQLRATVG